MPIPSRGDVWLGYLNSTADFASSPDSLLIISEDRYNNSAAEALIVLRIFSVQDEIPTHIPLNTPDTGLEKPASVLCEKIFSIPKECLIEYRGKISQKILVEIEDRLRILLGL